MNMNPDTTKVTFAPGDYSIRSVTVPGATPKASVIGAGIWYGETRLDGTRGLYRTNGTLRGYHRPDQTVDHGQMATLHVSAKGKATPMYPDPAGPVKPFAQCGLIGGVSADVLKSAIAARVAKAQAMNAQGMPNS